MANRYNQILDNNQYVSQHVPLPLEFINQQGANKQKESDTNKALVEQTIAYVRQGGVLDEEQKKLLTGQLEAIKNWMDVLKIKGYLLLREPVYEALKRGEGASPIEEGIKTDLILKTLEEKVKSLEEENEELFRSVNNILSMMVGFCYFIDYLFICWDRNRLLFLFY